MSKKPDLFERGDAARANRLAETDQNHQREDGQTGKGVIRRGNEALRERTGSVVYPSKGVKRD